LQGLFKNKEACPSLGDNFWIFGGYLFGGYLEEIWRKFVRKLTEIRRKLGGKNLIFEIQIF